VPGQNNSGCQWRRHGNAQTHATHVNDIFVAAPNPQGTGQGDQLGIRKVLHILRCFDEESNHITNDGSSVMSNLVVLVYTTAVLFMLQPLAFRIQAVSSCRSSTYCREIFQGEVLGFSHIHLYSRSCWDQWMIRPETSDNL